MVCEKDPARRPGVLAQAPRQPFAVVVVDVVLQRQLREHDPQGLGIDSLEIIVVLQPATPLGQSAQQPRMLLGPAADIPRGLHLLVRIASGLQHEVDDLHVAFPCGVQQGAAPGRKPGLAEVRIGAVFQEIPDDGRVAGPDGVVEAGAGVPGEVVGQTAGAGGVGFHALLHQLEITEGGGMLDGTLGAQTDEDSAEEVGPVAAPVEVVARGQVDGPRPVGPLGFEIRSPLHEGPEDAHVLDQHGPVDRLVAPLVHGPQRLRRPVQVLQDSGQVVLPDPRGELLPFRPVEHVVPLLQAALQQLRHLGELAVFRPLDGALVMPVARPVGDLRPALDQEAGHLEMVVPHGEVEGLAVADVAVHQVGLRLDARSDRLQVALDGRLHRPLHRSAAAHVPAVVLIRLQVRRPPDVAALRRHPRSH